MPLYFQASGQMDYRNTLANLKTDLNFSKTDTARAHAAVKTAAFYLTNKIDTKEVIDSCWKYIKMAEDLSIRAKSHRLSDDAVVIKARLLLRSSKIGVIQSMALAATGTLYCRLEILLAKYFIEKPGEVKSDLDSARLILDNVKRYAKKKGLPTMLLTSCVYRYKLLLESHLPDNVAEEYFSSSVNLCRKYGMRSMEARLLFEKGIYHTYVFHLTNDLEQALQTSKELRDTSMVLQCMKVLGLFELETGKVDQAIVRLEALQKVASAYGYKNLHDENDLISSLYFRKGNFELAMRYGLTAAKQAERSETDLTLSTIYFRLGAISKEIGQKTETLQWLQKCVDASLRNPHAIFPYSIYRVIAQDMIAKGKVKQVVRQLDYLEKKHPHPYSLLVRADCYLAMGRADLADICYQKIIDNERKGQKDFNHYTVYQSVANYYIQRKNYAKATLFIDSILTAPIGLVKTASIAAVEMLKFKADSANGDYLRAIRHLQMSKSISDSIYNQVKIRQTEQLQFQYATAKREQENLKLRNHNILQRNELDKEAQQKRIIVIFLMAAVSLAALMVYLYRLVQRSNSALRKSQLEINSQNDRLGQLLHEKEWLMKEIHHRVKNNLQIVSSLLNTQSSFLTSGEAKAAIRDSQNRMQAISIVHQKLYQSDDISSVNFGNYIEEISRSIIDSFSTNQNIRFVFDVADAHLSSIQTVPLGLILNEAITNSVKYAFADGSGIISVFFTVRNDGWYELTVRDNGKGLPVDFDADGCTSLGINLIAGLSSQLMGSFEIKSDCGTVITIDFPPAKE
jgi:two-component sensor histidine kinase